MTTVSARLTPEHTALLAEQAVTAAVSQEFGVRSVSAAEALELGFEPHYVNSSDGILFSWPVPERPDPVLQFRPDDPVTPDDKYVFRTGCGSFVAVFRHARHGFPWLFVEGSKQCLAAVSWAPPGWGVAGTGGCDMWRGQPLLWASGEKVVVMFDKDTATNARVWDAADELKGALELEDASRVVFACARGAGAKDGLDDVLGRRPADRRTAYLEKLVEGAAAKLSRRPKDRPTDRPVELPDLHGRVGVAVNLDRRTAIDTIFGAFKTAWDGSELFDFGGALTRLYGAETVPLEQGEFLNMLVQVVAAFRYTEATGNRAAQYEEAWPDAPTVAAVMSRVREFTGLDRIMRAPFVRADGSVCQTSGYDEASRTMLVLEPGLEVDVPEHPSGEQIATARKLLLEEWLGDMPFPTDGDRANALALVLTPFVRDRIDLAPLAVVDGLQMGVGKNLLADCLSLLVYGTPAAPRPLSSENEEVRKTITSALRKGEALVVFDEAHVIEGRALAQALTSETWSDRILGSSRDIQLPNNATWVALGNQVNVNADCVRRAYWIRLAPAYADPQDRPSESFRHPELKEWTKENRAVLLTAVLTLVRAWYSGGCGYRPRGESFGSFTRWEKTVGGILQASGVDGFLNGLSGKRAESDWTGTVWVEHLSWIATAFGGEKFTCADVKSRALESPGEFLAPPGLDDVSAKGWSRLLGNAYRSVVGVNKKGMTLYKTGQAHNNIAQYAVEVEPGQTGPEGSSLGGSGGSWLDRPTHAYAETLSSEILVHDVRITDALAKSTHIREPSPEGPPPSPHPPNEGVNGYEIGQTGPEIPANPWGELPPAPRVNPPEGVNAQVGMAIPIPPASEDESDGVFGEGWS